VGLQAWLVLGDREATGTIRLLHRRRQSPLAFHARDRHLREHSTALAQQDERTREVVRRLGHHVADVIHDEQCGLLLVHLLVHCVHGVQMRCLCARHQKRVDTVKLVSDERCEVRALREAEEILAKVLRVQLLFQLLDVLLLLLVALKACP